MSWMAWTWQTAAFFIFVVSSIVAMGVWEYFSPGGGLRRGVLGLDTTRGDRLFMSYLGSAFINLAWIAFFGTVLWIPLVICIVFAFLIFKFA